MESITREEFLNDQGIKFLVEIPCRLYFAYILNLKFNNPNYLKYMVWVFGLDILILINKSAR